MPRNTATAKMRSHRARQTSQSDTAIGVIRKIDGEGAVFVTFPGSIARPVKALLATNIVQHIESLDDLLGVKVVLLFEQDNLQRPVILDVVVDTVNEVFDAKRISIDLENVLHIKKRDVRISASNEIVLSCGKSQITLRKDGKIIIRGTEVTSRASVSNRVRGATVKIN